MTEHRLKVSAPRLTFLLATMTTSPQQSDSVWFLVSAELLDHFLLSQKAAGPRRTPETSSSIPLFPARLDSEGGKVRERRGGRKGTQTLQTAQRVGERDGARRHGASLPALSPINQTFLLRLRGSFCRPHGSLFSVQLLR